MADVRRHWLAPKVIGEHPTKRGFGSHVGIVFDGKDIVVDELAAQRVDVAQQRRDDAGGVVNGVRVSFADADVLFSEQVVVDPALCIVVPELFGERQPRGTAGAALQSHVGAWRARVQQKQTIASLPQRKVARTDIARGRLFTSVATPTTRRSNSHTDINRPTHAPYITQRRIPAVVC